MLTEERIKQYLQSIYTKTEPELEMLLSNQLNKLYDDNYHECGSYHFFNNESPILLVAHLDTVHVEKPGKFQTTDGYTYAAKHGIGADDRNGIVAILELLERSEYAGQMRPSVLLTCQEEVGGVGVRQFVKSSEMVHLVKQKNIFIQFDRKGANEFVTYGYSNEELFSELKRAGFKHGHGSYTDISTLMQTTDTMGVNFSAGYYNAHTKKESSNFQELETNINRVLELLPVLVQQQFFATEDLETYYSPSLYYNGEDIDNRYDQLELFDEDEYDSVFVINTGEELFSVIEDEALEIVLESPHSISDQAIDELYSYYDENVVNTIVNMIGWYAFNKYNERDEEYEFDI